jgi:L-lactate dehydrogenase complex protein LldG
MSAREAILSAVKKRKRAAVDRPAAFRVADLPDDPVRVFAKRASLVNAVVQEVSSLTEVPAAVAELLRQKNMEAAVHLPADPQNTVLDWTRAPGIEKRNTPPGPDSAAIAFVPYAIAETGTLVYPASAEQPASWHFRAGFEIAILNASAIRHRLEDVLAAITAKGPIPHTINLVTGPSRTGDIEQTLELGAHGPKALAILIVRD